MTESSTPALGKRRTHHHHHTEGEETAPSDMRQVRRDKGMSLTRRVGIPRGCAAHTRPKRSRRSEERHPL